VNGIIGLLNMIGFNIDPVFDGVDGFGNSKQEKLKDFISKNGHSFSSGFISGGVVPTNKNQNSYLSNSGFAMESIIGAVNSAIAQNLGSRNTEVVLEVDGREFGRAVVEQGDMENRRIGTRMVIN
jgi:hypothetical protein